MSTSNEFNNNVELNFKDYTISKPVYLDGTKPDKLAFTVCKKCTHSDSWFVIASFWWNYDEPCWEFKSCGTRYLEYYSKGLNEWLLKVMDLLQVQIYANDEDEEYNY